MRASKSIMAAVILALGTPVFVWAQESDEASLPGTPEFERTGAAPMFDFGGVQADLGGEPTRVLVLGTSHLNNLPEDVFDPSHLSLVLDRLEDFAPDIIAIETVGGRTCDEIQRYETIYPDSQQYCWDVTPALEGLEMTRPEAAYALEMALDDWPDAPSASDRRRLALLFYGAGEPWSAILQWSKLDEAERIEADGINAAVKERLDRNLTSRNENNLIGVEIANRVGVEQLATMDDHSADYIYFNTPEEAWPVVQDVWQTPHPLEAEYEALRPTFLGSPEGMLEGYLFANSEAYQRFTIEKDFGHVASRADQDSAARAYVSWWQTRGLRMTANVIEAAGNHPGANVLVIVGSSHKSYFDLYLDQMHDIELVSVEAVLGD